MDRQLNFFTKKKKTKINSIAHAVHSTKPHLIS